MAIKRVRVIIEGLVQGVGFRYFVQRKAFSLGITGWVRNRADGRVEALFEGEENAVDIMLGEVKKGPSMSRVSNVRIFLEQPSKEFENFYIKY